MEKRKVGNVTVNDGKGLYDNDGLLETVILDCNNAVKNLATGNYIAFCNIMVGIVQKVTNVRNGMKTEIDEKNRQIEELKQINNDLMSQITGLPVGENTEKDGAE